MFYNSDYAHFKLDQSYFELTSRNRLHVKARTQNNLNYGKKQQRQRHNPSKKPEDDQ